MQVYVVGSHCRLDPGFSSTGADSGLYASCLLNIDAPSVRTVHYNQCPYTRTV